MCNNDFQKQMITQVQWVIIETHVMRKRLWNRRAYSYLVSVADCL